MGLALVAGVGLSRRRRASLSSGGRRPALLPLFVAGFLAAVMLASTAYLGVQLLDQ